MNNTHTLHDRPVPQSIPAMLHALFQVYYRTGVDLALQRNIHPRDQVAYAQAYARAMCRLPSPYAGVVPGHFNPVIKRHRLCYKRPVELQRLNKDYKFLYTRRKAVPQAPRQKQVIKRAAKKVAAYPQRKQRVK